jgi:hypothetical protein
LNVVVLENTFQLLQYRIGVVEVRYLTMPTPERSCCILQISEKLPFVRCLTGWDIQPRVLEYDGIYDML